MTDTANWMPILGGIILIVVVGYFGLRALDTVGLNTQSETAFVTGKEHVPMKKGYRTDVVGAQTRVIPQVTPEMYVLRLRIGSSEAAHPVERELFDSVSNGDRLRVTYQRRRLTGGLQVTGVSREEQ